MNLIRPSMLSACLALALAVPGAALAQRALQGDLQEQMTEAEFKAAGLDKLSAMELEALNNWLQGKVQQATASVREQAREEGRQEAISSQRGLPGSGSNEPISARLEGEFTGFGKGRVYTLDNGQQWEQTDTASLPGVRANAPAVRITPGLVGVWYLQVEGRNARAKVRRIK